MDETRTEDIPQVSEEENNLLTALYTDEELRKLFSQWNIKKPQVRMDSQLSFTSTFGMSSKVT
jgi:hypothetical protein